MVTICALGEEMSGHWHQYNSCYCIYHIIIMARDCARHVKLRAKLTCECNHVQLYRDSISDCSNYCIAVIWWCIAMGNIYLHVVNTYDEINISFSIITTWYQHQCLTWFRHQPVYQVYRPIKHWCRIPSYHHCAIM